MISLGTEHTELCNFYPKHRSRTEQKHKDISTPVTKAEENFWRTLELKYKVLLTPFYPCLVYSRDTSLWGHMTDHPL